MRLPETEVRQLLFLKTHHSLFHSCTVSGDGQGLTDSARHPVDPSVLQEVGRDGPVGRPADEEGHLLAALEVVDHTGGGLGSPLALGLELSKLDGVIGARDGGGVVPEAGSRDAGATGMLLLA